jgi:hypothetical protein
MFSPLRSPALWLNVMVLLKEYLLTVYDRGVHAMEDSYATCDADDLLGCQRHGQVENEATNELLEVHISLFPHVVDGSTMLLPWADDVPMA